MARIQSRNPNAGTKPIQSTQVLEDFENRNFEAILLQWIGAQVCTPSHKDVQLLLLRVIVVGHY